MWAGRVRHQRFFFLQPNQYFEGSKPFTDVEKKVALKQKAHTGPQLATYYPLVRKMWRELGGGGAEAHDLSMLFEHYSETLYSDSCCHLNERGMTLIAEQIADAVVGSELLYEIPKVER